MAGLPLKGPLSDERLNIVSEGGVLIAGDRIVSVGDFETLKRVYTNAVIETVTQPSVMLPGFIDCHTHLCFAGSRAQDYTLKLQGKSYIDIAKEGGGINRTVGYTREVTEDDLLQSLSERIQRHLQEGVTTIEVKSGYGLSAPHEIKMLRTIQKASLQTQASIVPTCLGAHTLPTGYVGSKQDYLKYLVKKLLPVVKAENLSQRVDIFVEETAFCLKEAKDYLIAARGLGFSITLHADQFTTGGARLAVQLGAVSADHLEASEEADILAMAESNTVSVVLPGASLGLGIPFAPARKLLNAGCCLAIASDWNPGSAPMGDLLLQASLLSVYEKLSFSETIAGITYRAAKALELSDRGQIAPGMQPHFTAFPTNDYREILYNQGKMKPWKVWTS
jgi:imidazolonepropionase